MHPSSSWLRLRTYMNAFCQILHILKVMSPHPSTRPLVWFFSQRMCLCSAHPQGPTRPDATALSSSLCFKNAGDTFAQTQTSRTLGCASLGCWIHIHLLTDRKSKGSKEKREKQERRRIFWVMAKRFFKICANYLLPLHWDDLSFDPGLICDL